jgi:hypothetical protein
MTAAGKPGAAAPGGSAATTSLDEEGEEREADATACCALRAQPSASAVCSRYRGGSPSSAPADPGMRWAGRDESTRVCSASTLSESEAARPKARSSGTGSYWQSTRIASWGSCPCSPPPLLRTETTAQTRSAGAGRGGGGEGEPLDEEGEGEEEGAPSEEAREKSVLPLSERPGRTRAPIRETLDGDAAATVAAAAAADRRSAQDSGVVATICSFDERGGKSVGEKR